MITSSVTAHVAVTSLHGHRVRSDQQVGQVRRDCSFVVTEHREAIPCGLLTPRCEKNDTTIEVEGALLPVCASILAPHRPDWVGLGTVAIAGAIDRLPSARNRPAQISGCT